ncbi:hypothetical protein [Methanobacterium sp.]|uniref:hypothetical protein n=1 Tax=Methanobacterium sp. TaxID=2164 RepID=UPI002AB90928|nr:hypothetical protein [Methanobacterium sp.]MDY9922672.1 hypothetical protein [Methanobacterium sp.]
MVETSITFKRETKESLGEIKIPEDFIKDFHFSGDDHLMIMLRVIGTDSKKVVDFFEGSETERFHIKTENTVESTSIKETSGKFILNSMYLDEGPPLSVDINQEIPMVRAILDFKKK